MKSFAAAFTALLLVAGTALNISARPEAIKPGVLYYSDGYAVENGVAELADERNYEELFKNYRFYESEYDGDGRVILFRAYKRGDIEWTERYSYHPDGKVAKKMVVRPGNTEEVTEFEP